MKTMYEYEIAGFRWKSMSVSNDLIMNDSLPDKVWPRQKITDELNEEFRASFAEREGSDTYFLVFWDNTGKLVQTSCSSMDYEGSLESLMYFLRMVD